MVTICLQCGDKGYPNALIFCVKCLEVAVHRYCLDKLPKTFDDFVHWVCDDCGVELHKLTPLKSEPIQLERKEHTSPADEGSCRVQLKKRKICNSMLDSLHVDTVVGLTENTQLSSESSPSELKQKTDDAAIPTSGTKAQRTLSSSSLQPDDTNAEVDWQHSQSTGDSVSWEIDVDKMKNKEEKSSRNCLLSENVNQRLALNVLNQHAVQASISPLPTELEEKELTFSAASMEGNGCRPPDTELEVIETSKGTHEVSPLDKSNQKKRNVNFLSADVSEQGLKRSETAWLVPGHVSNNPSFDCHEHAKPLIDPIWRGSFNILNKDYDAFYGLVAHLSSKACHKVYAEASMLPSFLDLEMNPKSELWPKSFETSEPSDDSIALYFFPMGKRYERMFDHMVEEMMQQELAMRAIVRNAELLVFTSTELPLNYWRFQGKYYLWGVFRGKKCSNSPAAVGSVVKMREEVKHVKAKIWDRESPLSPLSNSLTFGLGSL